MEAEPGGEATAGRPDEEQKKPRSLHLQRQMVESHGPQGEGPRQQAHVREENPDGVLELGQFLKDGRRLDQLPVGLRLLDLQAKSLGEGGGRNEAPGPERTWDRLLLHAFS